LKKLMFIGVVIIGSALLFSACDQKKALDQILENPEMKAYMMGKMLEDESIKTDMVNNLLADTTLTKTIIDRMMERLDNREYMFDKLLNHEGMIDLMLQKMVEDDELKKKNHQLYNMAITDKLTNIYNSP